MEVRVTLSSSLNRLNTYILLRKLAILVGMRRKTEIHSLTHSLTHRRLLKDNSLASPCKIIEFLNPARQ